MTPRLKKMLIILGILLVIFGVYYFFTKGEPAEEIPSDAFANEGTVYSEQILLDTRKINTLNIDKTFFSDPLFTSLVDKHVPLVDIPTGRENPFATVR